MLPSQQRGRQPNSNKGWGGFLDCLVYWWIVFQIQELESELETETKARSDAQRNLKKWVLDIKWSPGFNLSLFLLLGVTVATKKSKPLWRKKRAMLNVFKIKSTPSMARSVMLNVTRRNASLRLRLCNANFVHWSHLWKRLNKKTAIWVLSWASCVLVVELVQGLDLRFVYLRHPLKSVICTSEDITYFSSFSLPKMKLKMIRKLIICCRFSR